MTRSPSEHRRAFRRRAEGRGVALIEALVALAVMAFGMLGVVGMQSTLRFNADVSNQRTEALRLAHEEIERLRSYTRLAADAADDVFGYEEIVSSSADEEIAAANTVFFRRVIVDTGPEDSLLVRRRAVQVRVAWADRRGDEQSIALTTQIDYVPLELAALPSSRGDRGSMARPGGRHTAIPRGATMIDGGRSSFTPPGSSELQWIFNNNTGLITEVCDPVCVPQNRALVSGYVAFALDEAPLPATVESPLSDRPAELASFGMRVRYTHITSTPFVLSSTAPCFVTASVVAPGKRSTYYCAVPLSASGALAGTWTGVVEFIGIGGLLADDPISGAPSANDASLYRICRYTPRRENYNTLSPAPVFPPGVAAADFNRQHPWQYRFAAESVANRNFVVIKAGSGSGDPFTCPADDPDTPIQGSTWHHAKPA